jgi:hypothetical protein
VGWKTVARLIDDDLLADYGHAQARILTVLAHHEGREHGSFPSERRLAALSHTNRRTVRATLALAVKRGLIVEDGLEGRSVVVYRFTGAARVHQSAATTGAVSTHRLVHSEHATGAVSLACIEPVVEQGRNSARTRAQPLTEDNREAWQILNDLKAEEELARRQPPTPEELAEIERKREAQDEADRLETARRDRELDDVPLDPVLAAKLERYISTTKASDA